MTSRAPTIKVESQSDAKLENKKRSTYHPIKIEEKNSDSERDEDIVIVPPSKVRKRTHDIDDLEHIPLFCASLPIPASKQLECPPLSSSFEPALANHQYHNESAPSPYTHHDASVDIFDPPFDALDNDYDAYTDFPSSPTLPPSSEVTSNHSSDDDCLSTNGVPSPKSHLQVPFPPLKQTSLTSFRWKKLDPQQKAEQLSKISLQMKETTALRKAQEDDRKKRKDDER